MSSLAFQITKDFTTRWQ